MATSTLSSQISCFFSINRQQKLRLLGKPSSLVVAPYRFKFSVSMHVDGSGTQAPTSETETALRHGGDASKLHVEGVVKPYPVDEEPVAENPHLDETIPDQEDVVSHKKTAKIHDFCLGIPFGGLVLSGGLVGSVFSRNLSTLGIGMLFGGGVLALSACSFKGWRQGKSTMPFILGQAVLLWKQLQTYVMTKKVFPSGFYALISAAMLCFYSYVIASGGNPPPKKLKGPWGNPTGKEVEGIANPTS
ncbi:hypothetical protein AQUCO_07700007v1 [Aquilegia coerulea]|uniref:Protein FATTY ACID EXPORT 1, chloroplastic n=1 Tax=Aquilegia coerulea TaxID=218851 RepID=A0A2G5C877_AQUCA|nr:hypothetical protein AQUCO_07700007v1 [Aquilegia coerulea]